MWTREMKCSSVAPEDAREALRVVRKHRGLAAPSSDAATRRSRVEVRPPRRLACHPQMQMRMHDAAACRGDAVCERELVPMLQPEGGAAPTAGRLAKARTIRYIEASDTRTRDSSQEHRCPSAGQARGQALAKTATRRRPMNFRRGSTLPIHREPAPPHGDPSQCNSNRKTLSGAAVSRTWWTPNIGRLGDTNREHSLARSQRVPADVAQSKPLGLPRCSPRSQFTAAPTGDWRHRVRAH